MGGTGAARLTIMISGGTIRATAGNDALDANGDIVMTGGALYLSGPSRGMDGAVDFDGTFTVTGGTLVAAGSVASPSNQSTQPVILLGYTSQVESGSAIELRSEATGATLLSYVSETACTVSGFTSPELVPGQTYSVWVNGVKRCDVALGDSAMIASQSEDGGAYNLANGRGGFGGMGGQMPMQGDQGQMGRPDGGRHGMMPAAPQP